MDWFILISVIVLISKSCDIDYTIETHSCNPSIDCACVSLLLETSDSHCVKLTEWTRCHDVLVPEPWSPEQNFQTPIDSCEDLQALTLPSLVELSSLTVDPTDQLLSISLLMPRDLASVDLTFPFAPTTFGDFTFSSPQLWQISAIDNCYLILQIDIPWRFVDDMIGLSWNVTDKSWLGTLEYVATTSVEGLGGSDQFDPWQIDLGKLPEYEVADGWGRNISGTLLFHVTLAPTATAILSNGQLYQELDNIELDHDLVMVVNYSEPYFTLLRPSQYHFLGEVEIELTTHVTYPFKLEGNPIIDHSGSHLAEIYSDMSGCAFQPDGMCQQTFLLWALPTHCSHFGSEFTVTWKIGCDETALESGDCPISDQNPTATYTFHYDAYSLCPQVFVGRNEAPVTCNSCDTSYATVPSCSSFEDDLLSVIQTGTTISGGAYSCNNECGMQVLDNAIEAASSGCCVFDYLLGPVQLEHLCYWRFAPSQQPSIPETYCHEIHFKTGPVVSSSSDFERTFLDTYALISANDPEILSVTTTRSDSFAGGFTYFKVCAASADDESAIENWTCNYDFFVRIFNNEARRDNFAYTMSSLDCFDIPPTSRPTMLLDAPRLRSIRLDRTGNSVTIKFESPTDRGTRNGLSTEFACSQLFTVDNKFTEDQCKFVADDELRVILNSSTQLEAGYVFQFLGKYIQMKEAYSSRCDSAMPVRWRSLQELPVPQIKISGPSASGVSATQTIASPVPGTTECENLVLTTFLSTGNTNAPWSQIIWIVDETTYEDDELDLDLLPEGVSEISVEITNSFGLTATASKSFEKSSTQRLSAQIIGPSTIQVGDSVDLFAKLMIPCETEAEMFGDIFESSYVWTTSSGLSLSGSTSSVVRVSGFEDAQDYVVSLDVSVGELVGTAEIIITATSPTISSRITQFLEFQSGAQEFIDVESLLQNVPDGTTFSYECETIRSYYVDSWDMDFSLHSFACANGVFEIHPDNQILIRDSSLVQGVYYRIHFLVNSERVGSITFAQNSHPGSEVCLFSTSKFADRISSTTQFGLDCVPESPIWECGSVTCDEMYISSDSSSLAFDPALATPGAKYVFTMTTAYLRSSFAVSVNNNPFGGTCVGPSTSPFAFETTQVSCMSWMDTEEDYPLTFEFVLLLEDEQSLILQRSTNPTWRGPLGFGYSPAITAQQANMIVNVYDSQGMRTAFQIPTISVSQPTSKIDEVALESALNHLADQGDFDVAISYLAALKTTEPTSEISFIDVLLRLNTTVTHRMDAIMISRFLQSFALLDDEDFSLLGGLVKDLYDKFGQSNTGAMSVELGALFLGSIEKIANAIKGNRRRLQGDLFSLLELEDLQRDILGDIVSDDLPDQRRVSFGSDGTELQSSKASKSEWSKCGGQYVQLPTGFGNLVDEEEFTCTLIKRDEPLFPSNYSEAPQSPSLDFQLSVGEVNFSSCSPLQITIPYFDWSEFPEDAEQLLMSSADFSRPIPDGVAFQGADAFQMSICTRLLTTLQLFDEASDCWVVEMNANYTTCACTMLGSFAISNSTLNPYITLHEDVHTPEVTQENVREYPSAFIVLVNLWGFSFILLLFLPHFFAKPFLTLPHYLTKQQREILFTNTAIGRKEAILEQRVCCFFKLMKIFWVTMANEHPFFGIFFQFPSSNITTRQRCLVFLAYQSTIVLGTSMYYAERDDPWLDELYFILLTSVAALVPVVFLRELFKKARPSNFLEIAKQLTMWEAKRLEKLEDVVTQRLAGLAHLPFATDDDEVSDFESDVDKGLRTMDYEEYIYQEMSSKLARAQTLAGATPMPEVQTPQTSEFKIDPPLPTPLVWRHFRERIFLLRDMYPFPNAFKKVAWFLGLTWSTICFYQVFIVGFEWFSSTAMEPDYLEQVHCTAVDALLEYPTTALNNLTSAYSESYDHVATVEYGVETTPNELDLGRRWALNALLSSLVSIFVISPTMLFFTSIIQWSCERSAHKRLRKWVHDDQ